MPWEIANYLYLVFMFVNFVLLNGAERPECILMIIIFIIMLKVMMIVIMMMITGSISTWSSGHDITVDCYSSQVCENKNKLN